MDFFVKLGLGLFFWLMEYTWFQIVFGVFFFGVMVPGFTFAAYDSGDPIMIGAAAILWLLFVGIIAAAIISRMFPDIDPKAKDRRLERERKKTKFEKALRPQKRGETNPWS